MIEEVETQIIEKLEANISNLKIEGFPENAEEYKLTHPKGAALVNYVGSTFSKPMSTGVVAQDREIVFQITLLMRNLRTHKGAYAHLDTIRAILTGFQPEGCKKFYPTRERFISENKGVWMYVVLFSSSTKHIEMDEEELLPLLKRITTEDEYGNTEVTSNE
jgi:hypothetical protein